MTVGKMIELLGGKAGVSCGRFHYGSAFGEPSGHADKVEAIRYKALLVHPPIRFSSDIRSALFIFFCLFFLTFSNLSAKPLCGMVSATMGRTSSTQVLLRLFPPSIIHFA